MPYTNDTHWCGAKPGEPHKDWDDVALCFYSGQQLIVCDGYEEGVHECKPSIWDGDYPGINQCTKYGLYHVHRLWGRTQDLSTLYIYGDWNVETQQHEMSVEVLATLRNS